MRLRTKYKRVKEELKRQKAFYISNWTTMKSYKLEETRATIIVPEKEVDETAKEQIKRHLVKMIGKQLQEEGKIEFTYKKTEGEQIAVTGRMKTLKEVE